MNHKQLVDSIRQLTRQQLQRLGVEDTASIAESILVLDGHYVGRRFCCGDLQCEWLLEGAELKVYSPDGKLVAACPIPQPTQALAQSA